MSRHLVLAPFVAMIPDYKPALIAWPGGFCKPGELDAWRNGMKSKHLEGNVLRGRNHVRKRLERKAGQVVARIH